MPKLLRVFDVEQNKHDPVVANAIGIFAAGAFTLWAGPRHLYSPLVQALASVITGIIARTLAVVDLKAVSGWAAIALIVWWAIVNPVAAGHLASNVGVFMSTAGSGLKQFATSI